MIFFLLLWPLLTWSAPPAHWDVVVDIAERHEFYQNNEVIEKPAGTWQLLFGLVYPDREMQLHKDCVFYRVPGTELGKLKINRVSVATKCESSLDHPGEKEKSALKSLQFSLNKEGLVLHFTDSDFRSSKWEVTFLNHFERPEPQMFQSSAKFKGPPLLFLAGGVSSTKPAPTTGPKDGQKCHDVSDECEELSPSVCHQCPQGWYEVPNGCFQGPKFCGVHACGGKNQPACRRGMKWQREEKKFECRTDSSFAYCSPGLSIQCEGALAYCR